MPKQELIEEFEKFKKKLEKEFDKVQHAYRYFEGLDFACNFLDNYINELREEMIEEWKNEVVKNKENKVLEEQAEEQREKI